jgi:hypothetical protein
MGYANGRYPDSALATTQLYYPGTSSGRRCLKVVQPHADALALAFALEFGYPLYATDGYRDYATQVALKAAKGDFAAAPGTSVHGLGKAFDLASGVNTAGSVEQRWVVANEARFGFRWPAWASNATPADGQLEPWHHEFVGGGASSPRVLPARLTEVGIGHTNAAKVREIQTRLNYHLPSAYRVVVDGDFGYMTAVAVVRFQMEHRAYVSGRVSLVLLARLRSDLVTTRYERALARLRARHARAQARLDRES